MLSYKRFPTTHTVAACLIAVPLTSLLFAGASETRNVGTAAPPSVKVEALAIPAAPVTATALPTPANAVAVAPATPAPAPTAAGSVERVETIRRGDSLARVFQRVAASPRDLAAILDSGALATGLKRIYPGQTLTFTEDPDGRLQRLSYSPSPLEEMLFERGAGGFQAKKITRQPEVTTNYGHATIKHSVFAAGQRIGLDDELTQRLAQIFQWDVDFVLDIRSGDEFSLLFEDLYLDGKLIDHGKILAADFTNQGTRYEAIYYEDRNGHGDYYASNGTSIRKAFIRAPVEFTRISSNYNPRRFHPIQKRIMPHRGIDYAAPYGTPVLASGDGRVVTASRTAPNGNYIVLQHGEQFQTKYLHLSKFGRGIRAGARVRQGQVIGYVGATGWATAPHLHYEFLVNGIHKNPRTVPLPKARPVPSGERARFAAVAQRLIATLDGQRKTRLAGVRADADVAATPVAVGLDGERITAATGG
jgi:murein DD-endopeptidase MepM/ murein hydrolase activator NlpD